ncbi:Rft-1-domain-containing protein [Aspergillus heteromorphus CBS 117.55]|uniref:Man(5)GlcNAc(2)-PP-dolichol translocation protein RFT1 n=1 Tax=Aspergillus heteromorphus CBS 117.55 TaxID=1448321 RepID=A0A317UYT1_9EURO|nr:Rft-1-domain-containing protein [Aspergillus heteromorphus CBS 117.55]PWY65652.1 Rft-1-domain-containing protein [Aspergillus heteromorphus CBS 117.55]
MPQVDGNAAAMLASSASGTTLMILVQLVSRLFTFTANNLILRSLPPNILGLATQLELYFMSILYFSRESIRMSIQRQSMHFTPAAMSVHEDNNDSARKITGQTPEAKSAVSQSVVNMSYLSLGLGFLFAMVFLTFYMHFVPTEVSQMSFYHASVIITTIASLMELSIEPFFSVVQQYMLHKKRAVVEMSAAFVKSFITCVAFTWASRTSYSVGVLPFALGYLCYSLTLIFGYIIALQQFTEKWNFSMFLTRIHARSNYLADRFSWPMITLSANVFFQSVIKHILTQGDSMMLATMTTLEDQGIYALASNYGGLLARVLFQPIEESSRALFSSLLNFDETGQLSIKNTNAAKNHLIQIMHIYSMMAVVGFPLGPSLVTLGLHVLGGGNWVSPRVSSLLSLYCYYIPFLAFNGIGESFVSSAANPAELRKQAVWMGVFSACYTSAAYLLLEVGGLGAHGMVYANILNMAVRTVWSFLFIRSFLRRHNGDISFADLSPRPHTCVAAVLMSTIIALRRAYNPNYNHVREGFVHCAIYLVLV